MEKTRNIARRNVDGQPGRAVNAKLKDAVEAREQVPSEKVFKIARRIPDVMELLSQCKERAKKLDGEISKIRAKMQKKDGKLEEIRNTIGNINRHYDVCIENKLKLEGEIADEDAGIKRMGEEMESLRKALDEKNAARKQLAEALKAVKSAFQKKIDGTEQLDKDIGELGMKVAALEKAIGKREAYRAQLAEARASENARAESFAIERDGISEESRKISGEKTRLQEEIEAIEARKKVENDNMGFLSAKSGVGPVLEKLLQMISEKNAAEANAEEANGANIQLRMSLAETNKANEGLRNQLQELTLGVEEAKNLAEMHKKQRDILDSDLAKANEAVMRSRMEAKSSAETAEKEMTAMKDHYDGELETAKAEIARALGERAELEAALAGMKDERAKQEISASANDNSVLRATNEGLQRQVAELTRKLEEKSAAHGASKDGNIQSMTSQSLEELSQKHDKLNEMAERMNQKIVWLVKDLEETYSRSNPFVKGKVRKLVNKFQLDYLEITKDRRWTREKR